MHFWKEKMNSFEIIYNKNAFSILNKRNFKSLRSLS